MRTKLTARTFRVKLQKYEIAIVRTFIWDRI